MANTNVNKVILGNETLLDLTGDTAAAEDVVSGKTFHLASGAQAVGTAVMGADQNIWYGTCPTAAATQKKVVSTTSGDFNLTTGNMVRVKFTYAQTYNGTISLNVDGTGEKNVMRSGATAAPRYFYVAGEVVDFVYDGTNFMAVNEGLATTTYYGVTKLSSSTASTSGSVAATPAAVKLAYDKTLYAICSTAASTANKTITCAAYSATLQTGTYLSVYFSNANTVEDALTFQLSQSDTAIPVWASGAATSASNPLVWDAGSTLTFIYASDHWNYISRDKVSLPESMTEAQVLSAVETGWGASLSGDNNEY